MRVVSATLRYAPAIGGAEDVIKNVFERLTDRGAQVLVLATTALQTEEIFIHQPVPETRETIRGVDVIRSPISRVPFKPLLAKVLDAFSIYGHGAYSWKQFLHLMREPCDIIHSTPFPSTHNYYAFLAAKIRRKPIVFTPHLHIGDKYHVDRRSLFFMMRHAAAVLTNTDYEREYCLSRRVSAEKVVTAGIGVNAVDTDKPRWSPKKKYEADELVLFLGRKVAGKGLETLIKAADSLFETRPGLKVLCVGPETSYSKALWQSLSPEAARRFIILGEVSEEDKRACLAGADVLVLPSTTESFGIVLLEAWQFGKPVIGANIGAVASVLENGADGLLFEPDNAVDLSIRLESILKDPGFAAALGSAGQKKVERRYTWDHVADTWQRVFEAAAAR